ncbi:MAG: bifunctional adenosylcobinamide kinase/adenosylcobinamide-phosphate guanylyltransferase [Acidimicrobiales bacterium]
MLTLVVGGARCGKSALAERMAAAVGGPVTYVATGTAGDDDDMAARIDAHRRQRPAAWSTLEPAPGELVEAVSGAAGTLLLDSLSTWLAVAPGFAVDVAGLCSALAARAGESFVVSDEVGMGVHPSSASGRQFRDALGVANQAVGAVADEVLLVVAGHALSLGGRPREATP